MAWDESAKTMAVNVIAKVEGGGAWDAINYNDPITIGLMQWYGTRAADLLSRIKTDHPTEYDTIALSLRNDVQLNPISSRYWTSRYLNLNEGNSLKPVLRASKDTQGQLVASDVDDYKLVCDRIGLNVDTNTDTAIFFMCMYHQSPQRAINLMKFIGMNSNLTRTASACMNETIFSRYRSRYTQARDIIRSGIPPTIIDLNDENTEQGDGPSADNGGIPPDSNGQESVFERVKTSVSRIEVSGSQLIIHLAGGGTTMGVPTGGNNFIVGAKYSGENVPGKPIEPDETDPTPSPDPDPPTGDDAEDTRNKLVKFMTDRIGQFGYTQGPKREKPAVTGMADCSSIVRFCYLSVTGKDVGTYTDDQVRNTATRLIAKGGGGDVPALSILKKGDLIITARHGIASNRIASHVEIYMGNGRIIGHGGVPYMGPVEKPMAMNVANKKTWWVKRLNSL